MVVDLLITPSPVKRQPYLAVVMVHCLDTLQPDISTTYVTTYHCKIQVYTSSHKYENYLHPIKVVLFWYTNIKTIMNGNVSPTRLIKSKFIQGPLQLTL